MRKSDRYFTAKPGPNQPWAIFKLNSFPEVKPGAKLGRVCETREEAERFIASPPKERKSNR